MPTTSKSGAARLFKARRKDFAKSEVGRFDRFDNSFLKTLI